MEPLGLLRLLRYLQHHYASRPGNESQRLLNAAPLEGRTRQADPIFGDLFSDLLRTLLSPNTRPNPEEGIGSVYPNGVRRDQYPPTWTPEDIRDRGQYYPPFDEEIVPHIPKGGYDHTPRFREVPDHMKPDTERGGPA
jgi:hypothetical protein